MVTDGYGLSVTYSNPVIATVTGGRLRMFRMFLTSLYNILSEQNIIYNIYKYNIYLEP